MSKFTEFSLKETLAVVKSTIEAQHSDPHGITLPPMLWSSPGEGKSYSMQQLAKDMEVDFQVLMPSQFDAGELGGFPIVSGAEYKRARPFFLPQEGKGILFVDELPQAPTANQNIMAQLFLDRCIGEHKLGDGWALAAAGNPLSSKAGTNAMPKHLENRLMHLHIRTDVNGFREYALAKGFLPEITTYLNERPEWLSKFDAKEQAYPTPRAWEKVNEVLTWGLDPVSQAQAIQGLIGQAALTDFTGYLAIWKDMPKVKEVLAAPTTHSIPDRAEILYALCSSLAHHANASNIGNVIKYIERFPNKEFNVFCMKDALRRFPELKTGNKAVMDWFLTTGIDLHL